MLYGEGTLLLIVLLFLIPDSRSVIIALTESSPYISGFVKFAILATMGDLMGNRIVTGTYVVTADVFWRMIVWGVIGCMVTLVFPVYMGGASVAQDGGLLPFAGVKPMQAFFGQCHHELDVCSRDEYLSPCLGRVDFCPC